MVRTSSFVVVACMLLVPAVGPLAAESVDDVAGAGAGRMTGETFEGLELRAIGPAVTSGRVSDIAVDPRRSRTYYVAAASGGVWKTVNGGTTWEPVFDGEGSYSIGVVTLDPTDPDTVWVGTGENNSQRSVGYGDGVYKSEDAGGSWRRMGLETSEHIGRIVVHPEDGSTVYVASQGPLWAPGGERGLFKTTDGGETWEAVLEISEDTGVSDLVMDPRDPEVLYAAAYQRRRHVWTLINGGPESGIHKTTDGGRTWSELSTGLPSGDLGRIGLALSPVDPDVLYAVVEATGEEGGFFRSSDAGASWEKRSDYVSGSPQYYQELFADPLDVDRVYSMDVWMQVTEDGGRTFTKVGEAYKHVDNHALWIDPSDTDHLLAGCDGGVYESFDRGATWAYKANLPITQFYKIAVDNDVPFYNVYGGTQDNFTLGGPSRTVSAHGIVNADWFVTVGGDGFQTRVDPEDPDILYSQSQYGNLVRFDRASGEVLSIQPQPEEGEALRYNWDAPLVISPHLHTRLYFGANRLFRSDDRGDSWTAVSPDLTRQIDRNRLQVMGRVWGVDAVSKNRSTSFYGNLVSLAESPLVEGLIYAGTDDGLIQITENGGADWRREESFPGVPEGTYVAGLTPSSHDADTVFAAFNNHKNGDFKPYLLKSTDRGKTWIGLARDLPERGSTYAVVEDHVDRDLLFVGTEFGLWFSSDGGSSWVRLQGGLPTVAVRDLAIQRREDDLVVGTFGRGFYILDDYSPLRGVAEATLERPALLPVREAWMYMPTYRLGLRDKSFQGDAYFNAPNPPFGAVLTYYLAEGLETRKEKRQEAEKALVEKGAPVYYPGWDELRAEDRESEPSIVLTVRDSEGNVVRRLQGPAGAGFHRVAWDLRLPAAVPTSLDPRPTDNPFFDPPSGPMVVPGRYAVSLAKRIDGEETEIAGPVTFEATPLGTAKLAATDRQALLAFQEKVARLQRAVLGAVEAVSEIETRLEHLARAADATPGASPETISRIRSMELALADIGDRLTGDRVVASRNEPTPPSIRSRVQRIVSGQWASSSAPTSTNREAYVIAGRAFARVLADLTRLAVEDLARLESELEELGAPWTPGRLPRWEPE